MFKVTLTGCRNAPNDRARRLRSNLLGQWSGATEIAGRMMPLPAEAGVPAASGTPASAGRSGLARQFQSHTLSPALMILLAVSCAGPFATARAAAAKAISGITEPFMDVTLGASVAGIVHIEFFKEGDVVKKGDVILELDKRLEELEVERRTAVMKQNKMQLDSTRALVQTTKSVSTEELAKKEAEYSISAAERGIAAEQLAHRQIVAPFSGAITEIQLHPGAACAPYQPLVRLVDTTRCYFVGQIEGNSVSNLKLDQTVKIEVDGDLTPVTGKICFISPVVDPGSGLAKVKALFENPDGKIRPGIAAKMVAE